MRVILSFWLSLFILAAPVFADEADEIKKGNEWLARYQPAYEKSVSLLGFVQAVREQTRTYLKGSVKRREFNSRLVLLNQGFYQELKSAKDLMTNVGYPPILEGAAKEKMKLETSWFFLTEAVPKYEAFYSETKETANAALGILEGGNASDIFVKLNTLGTVQNLFSVESQSELVRQRQRLLDEQHPQYYYLTCIDVYNGSLIALLSALAGVGGAEVENMMEVDRVVSGNLTRTKDLSKTALKSRDELASKSRQAGEKAMLSTYDETFIIEHELAEVMDSLSKDLLAASKGEVMDVNAKVNAWQADLAPLVDRRFKLQEKRDKAVTQ